MVDARRLNSLWPLYHSATPLRPFAPATPPTWAFDNGRLYGGVAIMLLYSRFG